MTCVSVQIVPLELHARGSRHARVVTRPWGTGHHPTTTCDQAAEGMP